MDLSLNAQAAGPERREKSGVMPDGELSLVKLVQKGSDDALQELIRRYDPVARSYSSSMACAGLDAEDLYQEGLLGLLNAAAAFREEKGASFRTYATLCIKRRMLSAVKSMVCLKHRPLNGYLSLDDEANAQSAAVATVVDPEDLIVSRERISALRIAVEKSLDSSERGILSMYLSGMTYEAMAELMHVSRKSIDNSLQKIRRRLISSFQD